MADDQDYDPGDEFAIFKGLLLSVTLTAACACVGLALAAWWGWL